MLILNICSYFCNILRHRNIWCNYVGKLGEWKNLLQKNDYIGQVKGQTSIDCVAGNVLSSITQLCLTLCDPMDCSTPGFPAHHELPELTQTHLHWVSDTIQPSHPLFSPAPPTFSISQHQGLFKWVTFSHQVAKILEFHHQSFQWVFRTDFL